MPGMVHKRNSHEPGHNGHVAQANRAVRKSFLDLPASKTSPAIEGLNQVLAETLNLRDLYKKHHWQVSGPTFYMLHLLFDKHYEEQTKLADMIGERVQTLGGIAVAMGADVAQITRTPRPPRGRERTHDQIARLIHAHDILLKAARKEAEAAEERDDLATNDLLVSDVLRVNELQVWFLSQHIL